jgi:hypothetical protein
MDLQGLLTLLGYSWRGERHDGDKGGEDGMNFAFDDIFLSDFDLHTS